MIHLKSLDIISNVDEYPYTVPAIKTTKHLDFSNSITIICGDNGSGKTTLVKSIAFLLNLPRITDDSYGYTLNKDLIKKGFKLSYTKKPSGFFFEGEAFINYLKYLRDTKKEEMAEIERINASNKSAYAKALARMPHARQLNDLNKMYFKSLDELSHGEAFLEFFKSRLKPDRLYIVDEAEIPLSPTNQLTLMSLIIEATKNGAQFIISAHSPILMAIPGANIFEATDNGFIKREYDSLESIRLWKSFLENRELYLYHLLNDND